MYNLYSLDDATRTIELVNYKTYIKELAARVSVPFAQLLNVQDNLDIVITSPEVFKKLDVLLNNRDSRPRVINNYIYLRLFAGLQKYIPMEKKVDPLDLWLKQSKGFQIGDQFRRPAQLSRVNFEDEDDMIQKECMFEVMEYFAPATSRLYLDQLFPKNSEKAKFKNKISFLVNSVVAGFEVS